jgi:hypothetical protein
VGAFEILSLDNLRSRLEAGVEVEGGVEEAVGGVGQEGAEEEADAGMDPDRDRDPGRPGLRFSKVTNVEFGDLIANPANANSVVQMASHADAAGWEFSAGYGQGLQCARACAAATVYRTCFSKEGPFNLCPTPSPALDKTTCVGVHWSTDVTAGTHAVALVLCTHIPMDLNTHVRNQALIPAVQTVLRVGYAATLAVAALLSRARAAKKARTAVYLTLLGGSKTPLAWVMDAMFCAMREFELYPLDVVLVC